MNDARPSLDQRKAEVKRRLSLAAVVEPHVKLSGSSGTGRRRGRCPFHGSTSPSLALYDAHSGEGSAYCFGCQWSGDLFLFHRDIRGIAYMDALAELEAMVGIAEGGERVASGSGPVQRERRPLARRESRRELIASLDMARAIWRKARPNPAAVRRYFEGRGVPSSVLTDARVAPFRFLAECPCVPWDAEHGATWPRGTLVAPAIMALVMEPLPREPGTRPTVHDFAPVGLHVTFLNPERDGTMRRRKPWAKDGDPDPWLPKRKMLGPVGRGGVLLGDYHAGAALYVGEGNETVLSGMALAGAGPDDVGIATLSLDNLQGSPRLWKNRTWPLFAIAPDPERPCFTIAGHAGQVTGLVDSDMSPLRGKRDRESGAFEGEAVVERKGGPIVRRAITGAERARICGELLVQGWRAAGVHEVQAVRAPLGKDFNDVAAERAEVVG